MPSPRFEEADRLNVVALISGGKDSFFSILHCQANGHRVVALANLYPPAKDEKGGVTAILPGQPIPTLTESGDDEEDEEDLNSFMYQTVGHQVIPLYADATGLPLYRRAITGRSGGGRDYRNGEDEGDETESMTVLLKAVMEKHPEVNAVCSGAVLSNYQRTRVESVAIRLGLVPLAYLWRLPLLSNTGTGYEAGTDKEVAKTYDSAPDDAILLDDLAEAGVDARIIKVASGGLDESFLWTNVASEEGALRVRRAMFRFGGAVRGSGSMIGEGGEFETLVVDGPSELFKKRIVVEKKRVVQEGGGSAWLSIQKARLEQKGARENDVSSAKTMPANPALKIEEHDAASRPSVRVPYSYDDRNKFCICELNELYHKGRPALWPAGDEETHIGPSSSWVVKGGSKIQHWCVVGDVNPASDIALETQSVMDKISRLLQEHSLGPTTILNTVVVLRHMSDFPAINKIYGSLFTEPNPPSRVCISCGDALPPNHNIAVYLSVHGALAQNDRQGLHVQSRSYWAPANIGPYSQAVSVPIASLTSSDEARSGAEDEARLVQIAGQIELKQQAMTMYPDSINVTIPVAIQHLWRIGEATNVQWWSSVVAYLPKDGYQDGDEAYAAEAWRTMHTYRPGRDDEDSQPDAWDRRNNPAHMTFFSGEEGPKLLPDIGVLADDEQYEDDDGRPIPIPAFIAAQVMTLPRDATVEFHAHLGFSNLKANSVRIASYQSEILQTHHTCVELEGKGLFVHTVLTVRIPYEQTSQEKLPLSTVLTEMNQMYPIRISALIGNDAAQSIGGEVAPTHFYVNTRNVDVAAEDVGKAGCPVIPCFNLWTAKAHHERITDEATAVAVYQNMFECNS